MRKARARAHILEGLTKAIDALDYIVTLIRNSRSVDEARQWLTGNLRTTSEVKPWKGVPSDMTPAEFIAKLRKTMKRLAFSEIQAQAILDLQLRRLSALERQKIIEEYESIIKLIAELEEILGNEESLRRVIANELEDVKKEFGDARRTEITDEGVELFDRRSDCRRRSRDYDHEERLHQAHADYYIFSARAAAVKAVLGAMAKNEDYVEHLFTASTHAYLMVFTDDGLVYKMKVHEVPDAAAPHAAKRS